MLDGAGMASVSEADSQETSDWRAAHEALTRLARRRAGLDFEEGTWLLAAQRAGVHARLGYGSFFEYIERLFGYSPRLTHDKVRVAGALESLPQLAQALRQGAATWSSVRELTRVATLETERAWLDAASGQTAHQVERLVSGHRAGDLPSVPKTASAERHVLRFEVSGEVLATFLEALTKLRRDADGALDDDAALLLMARQVLGGPVDDGRASYQVAMTVCEICQRATQTARGEAVEASQEMAAMARCDAQILPHAHVGETDGAHMSGADRAHVGEAGDARSGETKRALKATQSVPPAVRRSVLRRDQHRCQVPGCRHATFVDMHHIQAREEGGAHEPKNLLTLCSAHHRACHRGALSIEGTAPDAIRFRHADGTDYGAAPSPNGADVQLRAYRALRTLGFSEREARLALHRSATHVGEDAELEPLLRHAIGLLTARAWANAS
jgi:hypothetical protein